MHDSMLVANRLLELANRNDNSLTSMQIIKLVYIAHGWNLGLYGRPLIGDEVQAWQYGPVIPRLYNKVRKFTNQPVVGPLPTTGETIELSANEQSIIEQVYEIYGEKTGPALSRITHAKGTPWALTYVPGEFGLAIPNDLIEDHYARLAKAA